MVGRHKHATNAIQTQKHNRTKNRLLAEGEKILPLIDMGVMNKDGKIIAGQMDKFRQINKFLEMVDDT